MSENPFAMIPAGSRQLAPEWWTAFAGNALYISSLSSSGSMEDKLELLETLTGDSDKASDWINREMPVRHVTIVPVTSVNEDGEIATFPRVVLGLADGSKVGFGSEGIFKSIALIISLMGQPPWEPAINVQLQQKELPGAKRYYYLKMVRASNDHRGKPRK